MTADRLADKVFVLTGCGSGLGRHLARVLAARGARVVATSRRAEAPGILALDVRDPAAWERVLDLAEARFGPVDVLVHCAGIARPGRVAASPVEDAREHLETNALGTALALRAASRRMAARGCGHVVVLGSLAGIAPTPGISHYSASKFAVRGLCLAAALELRPTGVRVTVVSLDGVDTPMARREAHSPDAAWVFSGSRLLSLDEVARVVLGRVLSRRPLEVCLPAWRGWLCKLGSLCPRLSVLLGHLVARRGERNRLRVLRDLALR